MQQPKYYTTIVDLPLSRFIDCLVDNNIYALVISGKPTEEDLLSAWDDILMEYNFQMMDEEGKHHFNLRKQLEILKLDYIKLEICLQVLSAEIDYPDMVEPEKRFADDANRITANNFKFDHSKPDQFRKELRSVIAILKFLSLKIQIKTAEVEALNKNTSKEKPTKEYFQTILNTLSIGIAEFQLSDSMSVYSFCDWVKKYNSKIKFLESQNKK